MSFMNIFRKTNNSGGNFASRLSSNAMNNLVIFISFGVMIYILVQMIIVLNKPDFLYYTLSPMPTDLSTSKFDSLRNSNKMPNTFAREFTYSFWVYLRSINKKSEEENKYKLVFMRTEQETDQYFKRANPIVYFDKNSNKLIIKIRTTDADNTSQTSSLPVDNINDDFHNDKCLYSTLTVDYVPLKRWVNVIINVDNNRVTLLQGGTRSGKTYSIAYYLIYFCNKHKNAGLEIDICRDTYTALKSTAWKDFKDILISHNLYNSENHNKTDHIYNLYGNNINYYGADTPAKIHGRSRDILWVNECQLFPVDTINQIFPRTRHRIIGDYNPALPVEHWLDYYIFLHHDF